MRLVCCSGYGDRRRGCSYERECERGCGVAVRSSRVQQSLGESRPRGKQGQWHADRLRLGVTARGNHEQGLLDPFVRGIHVAVSDGSRRRLVNVGFRNGGGSRPSGLASGPRHCFRIRDGVVQHVDPHERHSNRRCGCAGCGDDRPRMRHATRAGLFTPFRGGDHRLPCPRGRRCRVTAPICGSHGRVVHQWAGHIRTVRGCRAANNTAAATTASADWQWPPCRSDCSSANALRSGDVVDDGCPSADAASRGSYQRDVWPFDFAWGGHLDTDAVCPSST